MAAQPPLNGISELDLDALIVGAGFGGCYLLKVLRDAGLRVKVLEAGHILGGVWCQNRYPGARVDCELPYYGYSDPAVWSTWQWTQRYPGFQELRQYFQHVDKVWKLSKDIQLNTEVVEARFADERWTVKTRDGTTVTCNWFLPCVGTSYRPYIPADCEKQMKKFKGEIHHSAYWPEGGVDFKNKKAAVIGAGSSGIQIMQEFIKEASSVTQFIRTPNFAVPMRQREISVEEIYNYKAHMPHVFKACRTTYTGLPQQSNGRRAMDDTPEQREAVWEEQWRRGGFNFGVGSYIDTIVNPEANRAAYNFWCKKVRAKIQDPKKADLLAPLEPPYYMGTKRPSLENHYYELCSQDHVEITNSPMVEITETGIQAEDKFREFDVIAIATGFDAVTGGLRTMGIVGRDGVELQDKWKDGVITHLGMMVHGFPNMFFVYGPQAPTSITNGPPFIEMQVEWIRDVILKQHEDGLSIVEASKEAEQHWRQHCLALADMTLVTYTDSWYMGANIPGKKREYLIYLGGLPKWHEAAREALDGWEGFDIEAE